MYKLLRKIHNKTIEERMNRMDIDIRQHIITNFQGDDYDTLRKAIEESIQENDELTLPGMGVFLELIWSGADDELKTKMIQIIEERVKQSK